MPELGSGQGQLPIAILSVKGTLYLTNRAEPFQNNTSNFMQSFNYINRFFTDFMLVWGLE